MDLEAILRSVGWRRLDLTFSIGAAPRGVSGAVFRAAVQDALRIWRQAVPFVFSERDNDGLLCFAGVEGSHGDDFDFFPTSDELAHAFGPVTGGGEHDGQVHLSNLKTWANGSTADGDVLTVTLHELGHALGIIDEFEDPAAVMNGDFPRGLIRRDLTNADVAAMRGLYASLLT
jgi:hypothetical protein